MDEISQGAERDPRLSRKTRRWLAAVAVAGLVAVAATVTLTRGGARQGATAPSASATTATPGAPGAPGPPGPQPTAFPGPRTPRMPDLRIVGLPGPQIVSVAGSREVLTAMLVGGRRQGHARLAPGPLPGGTAPGHATAVVQMLVSVDAGSTAIIAIAPGSRPYFRFVDGAGRPLAGGTVVAESCPDSSGRAELSRLGFWIAAGHTASVGVWAVPSARPAWLTFTAPARPAKPGT